MQQRFWWRSCVAILAAATCAHTQSQLDEAIQAISSAKSSEAIANSQAKRRDPNRPKLHLVTFSDTFDLRLMLPLATAYRLGLTPRVVGLGRGIRWGPGMGNAWNTYREFVFKETEPDDVVLFFDAYDVMFMGGEDELLDKYLAIEARTGRELVYNADYESSSSRKDEYPKWDKGPWKYLNSGMYMGRSRVLRKLFAEELPKNIVDVNGKPKRLQNWHVDFFLDNDLAVLDYECELVQLVVAMDGFDPIFNKSDEFPQGTTDLVFDQTTRRVQNKVTKSVPLMLHFAGPGHWPKKPKEIPREGSCLAYEVLRKKDSELLLLMEERLMVPPWRPVCTNFKSEGEFIGQRLALVIDRAPSIFGLRSPLFFIIFLGLPAYAIYQLGARQGGKGGCDALSGELPRLHNALGLGGKTKLDLELGKAA